MALEKMLAKEIIINDLTGHIGRYLFDKIAIQIIFDICSAGIDPQINASQKQKQDQSQFDIFLYINKPPRINKYIH